jgi:hypothetical protein
MVSRFRKGTMDHDGDGRRGGSLKGDTNMAKAPAKKAATRKAAKAAEAKAAVEQTRTDMATAMDPQSGMDIVHEEKPSINAAKKAMEARFAEADAKADPAVEEARLSREIRGY